MQGPRAGEGWACPREEAAAELGVLTVGGRRLCGVTLLIDWICVTHVCTAVVQIHETWKWQACLEYVTKTFSSFLSWVDRWWNLLMLQVLTSENTRNHSLFWLPDTRFTYTKLSFHFFFYSEEKEKCAKREMCTDSYCILERAKSLSMVDKPENGWTYKQKNQRSPSGKYLWILDKKASLSYKHSICYLQSHAYLHSK